MDRPLSTLRPSQIYRPEVMEDIHLKAELGRYRFRGFGGGTRGTSPCTGALVFDPHSIYIGRSGWLSVPGERECSSCSSSRALSGTGKRQSTRTTGLMRHSNFWAGSSAVPQLTRERRA